MEQKISPEESKKKSIRIQMHPYDVDGKELKFEEFTYRFGNEYCTTVDKGFYEDLIFGENDCKINMYNTAEYISMMNGKTYKVIKRKFQPCVPCMLILHIQEVQ